MNFAKRTNWKTGTNPLSEKLESLKAQGIEVLHLAESNPTQCGFSYLNNSILSPFQSAQNLEYHPDAHGIPEARLAVIHYYAEKGITLSPEQIFITANTSEAYSFVFKLLAEPGDQVLAPQPGYPLMDYLAGINDVELVRYGLNPDKNWQIDPSFYQDISDKTRALMLVNPGNPDGHYFAQAEKDLIREVCRKHPLAIISDEVFFDFQIDENSSAQSLAEENEVLTFTLSGISKILGLPQMKLSWIIVTGPDAERNEAIRRLEIIADTYLSASTPTQTALSGWMAQKENIQSEILKRIRSNHALIHRTLEGSAITPLKTAGGWTAVLKLPATMSDEEWAIHFLEKAHVFLHPGYLFDLIEEPYAVISLLTDPKALEDALKKMAALSN
ncbi:MAG: pyridoxal phosphate-dependent aminotransferase [Candidatus Omnitrophica bacterium]|nr:pyridoxal phosphate-dependent aminotransferase [Candidatus Omnitrophota bacterium]